MIPIASNKSTTIQIIKGKNIGRSIRHQLDIDHVDIGSAFTWNARTTIIAIDNNTHGKDNPPRFIDHLSGLTSILKIYKSRNLKGGQMSILILLSL